MTVDRLRWRAILWLAVGGGLAFGMITLVVLVSQSAVDVRTVSRESADAQLDAVRAHVGGVPCANRSPSDTATPRDGTPSTVHMLAWEREDERLVRVTTPYWALRAGAWKLNAVRAVAPPLQYVRLADLERCGPGLIVDRRTAGGGRVLVWLE